MKAADIEMEGREYRIRTKVERGKKKLLGHLKLTLPPLIQVRDN